MLTYPREMLNTFTHGSALPDYMINIKNGFILMLLRNLDPRNGGIDGLRYVVESIANNTLLHRIATGKHNGAKLTLTRISGELCHDSFPVQDLKCLQFPI